MSNQGQRVDVGRRVVCAALRGPRSGGCGPPRLVCGPRHFDATMRAVLRDSDISVRVVHWDQGFVDQAGVFMDRAEAWRVARASGQLARVPHPWPGQRDLFSEDLY